MRPVPRRSMAFGWIGRSHKPRCLRKRSRTKISRKGLTDATAAPISSRRTPANWSRGKSARRVGALSLRRRRETGRPRALGPLFENKTIDGKLGQRAARLPNLEDQTSCDRGTLSIFQLWRRDVADAGYALTRPPRQRLASKAILRAPRLPCRSIFPCAGRAIGSGAVRPAPISCSAFSGRTRSPL